MKKIWNKWDMNLDIDSYQITTSNIELVKSEKNFRLNPSTADIELNNIAKEKINKYDAVWMMHQDSVVVIEK